MMYGYVESSIGAGSIVSGSIAAGSVVSGVIASGAVTGQAGGGNFTIASGTVGTSDLGSGAVVSGRIASGVIGFGHLANASVQSGTVASGVTSRFHLASGALAPITDNASDVGTSGTLRYRNIFTIGIAVEGSGLAFYGQVNQASTNLGTLGNAPNSGNPVFWLPVQISGLIRAVPCW